MSDLCLLSRTHLKILLKSDFFHFRSFLLSHPFHFAFFVIFSPYIHKLLSYLFPLFITTSLFLLAFLTFIPNFIHDDKNSSETVNVSLLTATYRTVVGTLRSKIDNQRDDEHLRLEDFELFRVVFGNPMIPDDDVNIVNQVHEEPCSSSPQEDPVFADCVPHRDFSGLSPGEELLASDTKLDSSAELESNLGATSLDDSEKLGNLWEELDGFEDQVQVATTSVEEKKIEPSCTGADKAIVEKQAEKSQVMNGSEAAAAGEDNKIRRNNSVGKGKEEKCSEREYKSKLLKVHSHSIGASADYTSDINGGGGDYIFRTPSSQSLDYNLGSYGSMRKEKEWKRTLACKLFEERNNADETEGMDLLWETYETEARKNRGNSKNNKNKNKNKNKDKKIKIHEEEEEEIEFDKQGDEDLDDSDGQLCCLQALKFSTGKMNLGMGRPNLVKISKAIKGIGWLHSFRRHSKKVHNGDKY